MPTNQPYKSVYSADEFWNLYEEQPGYKPSSPSKAKPLQESNTVTETPETKQNPLVGAASGFLKRTASTLQNVGNVIAKPIAKGFEAVGIAPEGTADNLGIPQDDLELNTTAEKVGGFASDVAGFAVPGGAVSKGLKGASLGRQAITRFGTSGAVGTAQEGNVKEGAMAGAVDAVLPFGGAIARGVGTYGKNVLKGFAGFLGGTGGEAVERVFKNPDAALKGMQGNSDDLLMESAQAIREGVKTFKQRANSEYADLIAKANTKGRLALPEVKDRVENLLRDELDAVVGKNGLEIQNTPFLDAEERQFQKLYTKVKSWTDDTPEGLNRLAQSVSKFRRGSQDSADFDRIIDNVRRNIREYAGEKIPEISEANRRFADKMDLLDDVEAILKTRGAVESREGLRKTAEAIETLFNRRKELARKSIDELQSALGIEDDIVSIEAGRQFNEIAPRSTARIGGGLSELVTNLIPANIIGSIVRRAGALNQRAEPILEAITQLEPSARGALIELLSDLTQADENPVD